MSSEGIYFIYDPGDNGFVTFATAEERDAFAAKTIENCLDNDEWDSEVARICVGVITGRATYVRVEHCPPDTELDEERFDKDGTHWPDGMNERFDIEILLTPTPERAALDEIRESVQAAMKESDLSKLDLARILEICGEEETPALQEMRDLLAGAASPLKDKLMPDDGQLRTQWDKDVDEWMVAAAPLFQEDDE